jgi:hypothetical protein
VGADHVCDACKLIGVVMGSSLTLYARGSEAVCGMPLPSLTLYARGIGVGVWKCDAGKGWLLVIVG